MPNNPDQPTVPENYDRCVFMEWDWTSDDVNLVRAVNDLYCILGISGRGERVKSHIRALLIMLVRMNKYAQGYYLAYSRDNNQGAVRTRNNPDRLSFRYLRKIVDGLSAQGYVRNVRGIYYDGYRRMSRLAIQQPLLRFIESYSLGDVCFTRRMSYGGIFLKDAERRLINYQGDEATSTMKAKLASYNSLLSRSQITTTSNITEALFEDHNICFRVFNNSSFTFGGRYYGAWWTICSKDIRRRIRINGERTVELDYRANHLYFLYGINELQMPERFRVDPYSLEVGVPRGIIKLLLLYSLNAENSLSAYRGILREATFGAWNRISETGRCRIACLEDFEIMLGRLMEYHPILQRYCYTGIGSRLMNYDSSIAEYVLHSLTGEDIPCLCIHDSFIVSLTHENRLRDLMTEAYSTLGMPLALPPIERLGGL